MKFRAFFSKKTQKPSGLADLLLHTPAEKQKDFFTKAAERANADQRATLERAHLKQAAR